MVSFINKIYLIKTHKMNLIDRLKTGAKKAVLVATAVSTLGFGSCRLCNNYPPVIESTPVTEVNEGETYGYQVEASDADGDVLEYELNGFPEGFTISDSGLIQGTAPLVDSDKGYSAEIKVSDGREEETQEYDLLVKNQEPAPINYNPYVDLSAVDANLLEEAERIIYLPEPIDPNTEDNPVPYISAISLDGKVVPTLNGNQLTIKGNKDEIGTYQVELEFGTSAGGTFTKTLEGMITDLPDISGQLQDNETDSEQAGLVKIYRNLEDTNPYFVEVDSLGDFNIQLDESLSEIILQARMGSEGNWQSYVRTRSLDGTQDLDVGAVRVVPYDNSSSNYDNTVLGYSSHSGQFSLETFKTFMEETNFDSQINGQFPEYIGLTKWNFGELPDTNAHPIFKGIKIVESYEGVPFLDPDEIKTILETSDYPKSNQIDIEVISEANIPSSYIGWGIIFPSLAPGNNPTATGATATYDSLYTDGYIECFKVDIKPSFLLLEMVTLHETFGHGMVYMEHTTTLGPDESIINAGTSCLDFTPVDVKGSYIVDEPNYLGMEQSKDILGLNWLDD